MMQLDYTFERQLELEREESFAKGREEGREDGMEQMLLKLIRKKIAKGKTIEQIAEELEENPEVILPLYQCVKNERFES